jgi:hypothetical protein
VFYPGGAHDCFNVLADLRPRMVNWLDRQISRHRPSESARREEAVVALDGGFAAAEMVDPEFADALIGEAAPRQWHTNGLPGMPVQWEWPWSHAVNHAIEVVHRTAGAAAPA